MITTENVRVLADQLTHLLTRVARHTLAEGHCTDFAEVITRSMAAAAANVGGPDIFLSGRPGSWESSSVACLLGGAMGQDSSHWASLRTEPLVIPLNVAERVEDSALHPGLVGLTDARDRLDDRSSDAVDDDPRAGDYDFELADLERRYSLTFATYAARFRCAVSAVVEELGLDAVDTAVDADPEVAWWCTESIRNPAPLNDPLVTKIWERAHAVVPLPNVDLDPSSPAESAQ